MDEYVKREVVLADLDELAREPHYQHEGEDWRAGVSLAREALCNAPAVAVVTEVVRCEKCLKRDTLDCPLFHAGIYFVGTDDGFCFWGKKKEG